MNGKIDSPAESTELIDHRALLDYAGFVLRSLGRHRLLASGCFFVIVVFSVVALLVLPKRYEVLASLLAVSNPLFLEINQHDAPTLAAREAILRRDNLVALVRQTDFVARHEATRAPAAVAKAWIFDKLRGPLTAEQKLEIYADAIEARLWVVVSGNRVELGFIWSDPELAFDVVEAAKQRFLEARFASEVSSIEETISIFEEHATRVNREIADKTKEVEALERELRAASGPRRVISRPAPVRDEAMIRLESRLEAKRRTVAELEEYRRRRVTELQAQLVQQESMYAEQHPALVATRRSIEALANTSPQLESLRDEVSEIEKEIARRGQRPTATARSQGFSMSGEIGLGALQEDPRLEYERHKLWLLVRQHSSLLERIDSARVVMDTARAGFKYRYSVVSPPQMPKGPLKPKAIVVLAMGVVGGVLFAVFASVAADLWTGVLLERWEIERRIGVPVLADLRRAR